MTNRAAHPLFDGLTTDSPFVRAIRGDRPERVPVWFALPADGPETGSDRDAIDSSLDPVRSSELTVEVWRRHGTDAVGLATHALAPLRLAGVPLEAREGGAVVEEPVRRGSDVLRLRPLDPAALDPIRAAAALAAAELGATPLVGLALAPFSLATLLVEGRPSSDHLRARTMMYADPHAWAGLLNWCADVAGDVLLAQVEGGASVVELADPAAGALSRRDYFKRVLPHTQRALSHLRGIGVPIIHTAQGAGEMLDLMARSGVDAVGVDRRIPLDAAAERVGPDATLQGNLDPALLTAPARILEAHVEDVLDRGRAGRAHVLSLGGDLPRGIDRDVLTRIVELARGEG